MKFKTGMTEKEYEREEHLFPHKESYSEEIHGLTHKKSYLNLKDKKVRL